MSSLFDPLDLRGLTFPNRVWMSPMCMYSAAAEGDDIGVITDFHLAHYTSRAIGGVGLVMVEATSVRPDGRISPYDLGLWNDRQQDGLARVVAAVKKAGAVTGVQLAHAGRKASTSLPWEGEEPLSEEQGGWELISSSALPFDKAGLIPHELTIEEIHDIVEAFAAAAKRAHSAGFDVIEIHGAHGYLINSFLSELANQRTDQYGGPFENRIRFALEVVTRVREVWPEELPIFFRVSATDWLTENAADSREGWSSADTVRLAHELAAVGVDLIDTSTGGIVPDADIKGAIGYQVPYAADIQANSPLPAAAVGLILEPRHAQEILTQGHASAVFLGRALLLNAQWANDAARELNTARRWPIQYSHWLRHP
jgi:2,4-dienoyl-CoA reductase-like NADH-dependent reductase (Old Yellow Enzyme family)